MRGSNNWRDVPLPDGMQGLPVNKYGMVIPYIVFVDAEGKEHFVVNDSLKVFTCLRENLCAICGQEMSGGDIWMLGGPNSAFHERGAYLDTAVHHDCGEYALRVCPYLASKNYNAMVHDLEKINAKIAGGQDERPVMLFDDTVDPTRPSLFVFSKVEGYNTIPKAVGAWYVKPYGILELEFWAKGERLGDEEAERLLREYGYGLNGQAIT